MKLKTIIVEDEPVSRERLKQMLQEFPEIEVIGEAGDGPSAVEMIDRQKPDLIFLDIHIPGCSGLEVAQRLAHHPHIVFITAFDQYAIQAFEQNALDYLLKPTSRERLKKTLERIIKHPVPMDDRVIQLLEGLSMQKKYLKRFTISYGDEILLINEDEVIFFSADAKYIFLHTENKRFIINMTLKELEEVLDPEKFCRVHKGHIVALAKIDRIKKWFHGEYILQMLDGKKTRLKISRNYLPVLKRRLPF